jgi:hypothetical protein
MENIIQLKIENYFVKSLPFDDCSAKNLFPPMLIGSEHVINQLFAANPNLEILDTRQARFFFKNSAKLQSRQHFRKNQFSHIFK